MQKRTLWPRLVLTMLGACLLATSVAAQQAAVFKLSGDVQRCGTKGGIDWGKGVIYATGYGPISRKESNRAKAYLKARRFAEQDAYRNLRIIVDGIHVDSRTVSKDFEVVKDELRTEVEGFVKGGQIIAEDTVNFDGDRAVKVIVATAMYGDQGLARILLPELGERNEQHPAPLPRHEAEPPDEPEPQPVEPVTPPTPREEPPAEEDGYSSVIIDTRGLNVERCMSPKIVRPDGSEVWGTVNVSSDYVIDQGIVVYARSMGDARRIDRAGNRPLIIKAVGRGGSRFHADAMISNADADRLLSLNARQHFLDHFNVIFVVDPARPLNL